MKTVLQFVTKGNGGFPCFPTHSQMFHAARMQHATRSMFDHCFARDAHQGNRKGSVAPVRRTGATIRPR
jgi:hypothetical protein